MPKAKNPITEEERSKRFEEEVRRRKDAGDFDPDVADAALDKLVRRSRAPLITSRLSTSLRTERSEERKPLRRSASISREEGESR